MAKKGPSGVGTFFIVLFVLVILGVIGWVVFTQLRARRLGLPPPSLASYNPFKKKSSSRNYPAGSSSGPVGWVKDKIFALRNRRDRTADGAYEGSSGPVGGGHSSNARSGFGPLDPDEAWDARVGAEADGYGGAYYEETELDHRQSTAYGGGKALPQYGQGASEAPRGRSHSREPSDMIGGSQRGLDQRYDEEMGRAPRRDPFGDAAEPSNLSLRGVSPRPMDQPGRHSRDPSRTRYGSGDSPPEHKSAFRENM